jgi:hypothetical protein
MNTYSISDVWTGTNAQNIANLEEAELSLAVSEATSGNVTIDWWGLSCTELEAAPAVTGPWTVVMGAEGVGSTTMETTADQQYMRLTKPAPGAPASP